MRSARVRACERGCRATRAVTSPPRFRTGHCVCWTTVSAYRGTNRAYQCPPSACCYAGFLLLQPGVAATMNAEVLVLNSDYQPLNVCNLRRAIVLVQMGKADVLHHDERWLRSFTDTFVWPSVV